MGIRVLVRHILAATCAAGIATVLAGCGDKEKTAPAASEATAPAAAAPPVAGTSPAAGTPAGPTAWTAEALEELLAPIALYPDPVLSQVLIASTNPQEVLDAGNWLLQNESLKGKALDDAAAQVGFTPPIRSLVQFPATVDMMCLEMGWTTELGQAFTADQAGVLDAVQRLRKQAKDVGNLQSSEQMLVETEVQEGKEVVVLKPAEPEVIYVPQYNPQTVYAPAPVAAATPAATTTTTTTTSEGHSTGSLVATGILAFGAGILVSELMEDDDDYYYPNYGHGGMPYYPPYPYRPSYGGGYYPNNNYNRPPNYNSGFQNTGNINTGNVYVNTGGNRPGNTGNNYWDRYDSKPGATSTGYDKQRQSQSPISAAKPNRPELNELNQRQPRPMPQDVKRPAPDATASNWKGQSGYAGKTKGAASSARSPQERINAATPAYSKPATSSRTGNQSKPAPKVQGSYAGQQTQRASTRDVQKPQQRPTPQQKPQQRPANVGGGDRGYDTANQRPTGGAAKPSARPAAVTHGGDAPRSTATSGANRGSADRAASQRGKQSLPQGARSKGSGGGRQRSR